MRMKHIEGFNIITSEEVFNVVSSSFVPIAKFSDNIKNGRYYYNVKVFFRHTRSNSDVYIRSIINNRRTLDYNNTVVRANNTIVCELMTTDAVSNGVTTIELQAATSATTLVIYGFVIEYFLI